jgi:AcrR family transcriptional regulator
MPRVAPTGAPPITRRRITHRIDAPTASPHAVAAAKPAGTKGRRTSEEARQEIIEVARAYIAKNGIKDLTVDRLMRGTKIGRSAFYVYFASIHELAAVFVHELAAKIETVIVAGWYNGEGDPIDRIRTMIRGGVEFWEANGPMIRALEEASWHDDNLRTAFRDEIGLRPTVVTTEAILRDQAKGWIGPMDAREVSVVLNRLNLTYLNDRFGNPRRRSKPTDKETAIEVLTRVWTAALYGKVVGPKQERRAK